MNTVPLIMMLLTQGLVIGATGYFLYKVLSAPKK
jgi:hypothetical protein